MTAKTYKTKFIEPLFNKLIGLVKELAKQCIELQTQISSMKMWGGFNKSDRNILARDNAELREENEELSRDILKFRLLRKVFGDEQMDKVVEQATEIERANRRGRYLNGRER